MFGRELGIENGATKKGNQTVAQLKQQSKLAAEIEQQRQELQKLAEKSRELASETAKAQKEVKTLAAKKSALMAQIKPLQAFLISRDDIDAMGKPKMGGKILYTASEVATLKEQALGAFAVKSELEEIRAKNNALVRRYSGIDSRLDRASSLVADLKAQNSQLTDRIEHIESVLASNPQLMELFRRQSKQLANSGFQQRKKGIKL